MKKTKSKMSGKKVVAIGAGMAAGAAAVGAGAYYLLGPNKKAHQKKAKILMARMKKEAMSQAKKAKKLGVPVYHQAIDIISENYAKQYKMHEKDIRALAKKLKSEYKSVVKKVAKKAITKKKRG